MAGTADGDLAGAALGERQPHKPRQSQLEGLPGIHDRRGPPLRLAGGALKPLYYAWPVPLVVSKQGHGFSLWGLVRPATGSTKVTILVKARGSKKYRVLKTATTESLGYWSFTSSTAGVDWKVRWTGPSGVKYEGPPIGATPAP